MNWDILFFLNSALLGVGLAMDAFSVSLANGLHEPKMSGRRICAIALVYAVFQYAMPMIGWVCVRTIADLFAWFRKLIPWIALGLLLYIGGKMLLEGLRERKEPDKDEDRPALKNRDLVIQGVATSIDALSVGFTLAEYRFLEANAAGLIIGAVTFVICFVGIHIGRKAGTKLSWRAAVLGGVILILIGLEIFAKGVIFHQG